MLAINAFFFWIHPPSGKTALIIFIRIMLMCLFFGRNAYTRRAGLDIRPATAPVLKMPSDVL